MKYAQDDSRKLTAIKKQEKSNAQNEQLRKWLNIHNILTKTSSSTTTNKKEKTSAVIDTTIHSIYNFKHADNLLNTLIINMRIGNNGNKGRQTKRSQSQTLAKQAIKNTIFNNVSTIATMPSTKTKEWPILRLHWVWIILIWDRNKKQRNNYKMRNVGRVCKSLVRALQQHIALKDNKGWVRSY